MGKERKAYPEQPVRKVKTNTLVIVLLVGLVFSVLIGVTAGAMGLGSIYPQLNLIASPFACPGQRLSYSSNVREIGTARYYTATYSCVDDRTGATTQLDPNSVFFSAGPLFGLVFFGLLLLITYFYWNSSIGPAKNGGPRLW